MPFTSSRRIALLTVLATTLAASGVIAAASAIASGNTKQFKISSTLDGRKVLPHRIHWLAFPKLPRSQVAEVDFLIDGKVRWIERNAPYTYGDDGNWLVTSWLSPGRHRFTVRAKAFSGITAQRTTIASVLPAPPPPAELAGTWNRTFTQEQAGNAPAGTWVLTVDTAGWKIRDPTGTGAFVDVAYLTDGRLEARGGIWTKPHNPYEGNAWCEDTNAPVDYRWAVSANTLTLTLDGSDRCGAPGEEQHLIWAGAWTRLP